MAGALKYMSSKLGVCLFLKYKEAEALIKKINARKERVHRSAKASSLWKPTKASTVAETRVAMPKRKKPRDIALVVLLRCVTLYIDSNAASSKRFEYFDILYFFTSKVREWSSKFETKIRRACSGRRH